MNQQTIDSPVMNETLSAVIADQCREDKGLAASLLSNSRKAMGDLTNVPVSDSVDISVVQNTPDTVHIPLPHYASWEKADHEKLTEDQMAQLSGGEVIIAVFIGTAAIVSVAAAITVGVLTRVRPDLFGKKDGGGASSASSATASHARGADDVGLS